MNDFIIKKLNIFFIHTFLLKLIYYWKTVSNNFTSKTSDFEAIFVEHSQIDDLMIFFKKYSLNFYILRI